MGFNRIKPNKNFVIFSRLISGIFAFNMLNLTQVRILPSSLVILSIALIVGIVFYLGQIFTWQHDKQATTQIFQQSFNASINQYEYLPAIPARDNLVKLALTYTENDISELNQRLQFIAERSGADTVYIMNATGLVIATSNFDQRNTFLNQNYSYRPYFKDAITQSKRQFYYAIGATTGIPGLFISEPVFGSDNEILGVVVVKLDLSDWERNWQNTRQNILVADNNEVIILSGISSWRYHALGKLSADSLQQIKSQRQFQHRQPQSLYSSTHVWKLFGDFLLSFWIIDGDAYLVNSSPITGTGWTLYNLKENQHFLVSSIFFLVIFSVVLTLGMLYLRERQSKILSRQQAQESEKRHRRELETIIEKIHIGIISLNQRGEMLFMNDASRHMLRVDSQPEVLPAPIQQVLDVSKIDNFDTLLQGKGDIIKPFYETTVLNQSSKDIPVMFAISQVAIEGDKRLLLTLVDIEKRKRAEKEVIRMNASLEQQVENRTQALRDAQAELIQQNKAAALGQMAATIVHELSQPLSAMNSSIAAIRFKTEKDDWDGALQSVGRLIPLNQKMQSIIKLLKSFSYQDETGVKPQDLAYLVEQSLLMIRDNLQEKNITIVQEQLESSVNVKVNPLKFDLVLVNIIQNAIDAMTNSEQPMVKLAMFSAKGKAVLTIEDSGGGINSRVMGQLFDPYYTTKEIGKGLGLGLSICHEIIREYGGTIQAENCERGARFIIQLPLAET